MVGQKKSKFGYCEFVQSEFHNVAIMANICVKRTVWAKTHSFAMHIGAYAHFWAIFSKNKEICGY